MLHVSLLGEQAITRDGTSVHVRSSRGVALVGFLVVHAGVPQARERIAGLFWPESADGQALTNLRRELHHVRQVLAEEPSLVVTSRDLCWRDTETCRVDVRVFVFAVSAGGVLYAFAAWRTRYLDSVSARRLARIPLSLLLLELSGYCVSAVQLHVHAADVLVRRGVGGDGSRSAVLWCVLKGE